MTEHVTQDAYRCVIECVHCVAIGYRPNICLEVGAGPDAAKRNANRLARGLGAVYAGTDPTHHPRTWLCEEHARHIVWRWLERNAGGEP